MAASTTGRCTWDAVRAGAQTGDMLLFCGTALESRIVEMLERRNYSHCAMLVVVANDTEAQRCAWPVGVYVVESDLAAHGDWATGNAAWTGVQLVRDSATRVRNYEGTVYWVPLTRTAESNLTRTLLLKPYLAQLCGYCPYNLNLIDWGVSGLRGHETPQCDTRDLHGHYCISFVCEALQTMQVMTPAAFNAFNVHFNSLTEPWRRVRLMTPGNTFSDCIWEIEKEET